MSDTTSYLRENREGHSQFLVCKAKRGSEKAWRLLYDRYRTMLLAQVRARIPGCSRAKALGLYSEPLGRLRVLLRGDVLQPDMEPRA